MHSKKVVIFDLYDTILKDIYFNFNRGIEYLYGTFFKSRCTKDEFMEYSASLYQMYADKKSRNEELAFTKEEYSLFCRQYNVYPDISEDEIDYQVMIHMQKEILIDGIKETLKRLHDNNVECYILSNSIFSSLSHKRLLNSFGIDQYFVEVYSSADVGKRKPDKSIFDFAVGEVLARNKNIKREEIFFVGNDYETDVKGAIAAGLQAIWLNVDSKENREELDIEIVGEFSKIEEIILDNCAE